MARTQIDPIRLDRLAQAVEQLDLDPIKFKMLHPEEGVGWMREKVDRVERVYRRFLFLVGTRSEPIILTKDVDVMWHHHILDTAKYRTDCDYLFGYFLDHFPYFGMRGQQDSEALFASFTITRRIYQEQFGSDMIIDSLLEGEEFSVAMCDSNCYASCGSHGGGGEDEITRPWERPALSALHISA